ncbi:putative MFS family arabinose efflux permease [Saccharopolyspora erythraea NRRL 2338]|uniref:Multidrug transporter n=2 Tax=Saccharopolyspora erythraea TaxID=1836 RepID=A4FEN1_SACEN|nr:MFS transporter [Saccharopolyspora erythraea]EQD81596.1 major facilitator transporter [Saccharopolyspora erythraea D]PFG96231.1 putative MFS family arabinose efflux permease [Saccharopolyspora erythraea NRRL 2338]QRK92758.1 MFS transporter [Saccharopolyspora erythraea]CAM02506.1 multidrug transporter [Saccharopolyspora erythraea NRRL 2338]
MTTIRNQSAPAAPPTRQAGLLAALVLAVAGFQINATMLTPALPDVIERLHTTSGPAGLSQTLFFLFAAIGQVTIARLSDHLGRRRMLLVTLAILIVGEVVCVLAPNIEVFVVGRMLQGISSAAFTLAYLILHESLSPQRFGRALGVITAVNGGIAGVDAVIGGTVADSVGFRGIFLITLVLTAVATAAVHFAVPESRVPASGRMDWRGAALLGIGLTGVLLALNEGGSWGWTSPATLVLLLAGLASLVLFAVVQKRTRDGIIDVSVLASRQVWPLLLTTVFTLAGVFGMLNFTIPLLTQTPGAGYGMSATTSALLFLTPASALGLLAAPLAGQFAPRLGWRRSVLIGAVGTAAAFVPLVLLPQSPWVACAALAALGITYTGYSLTALNGLAVASAPADKPGSLPGLNGACFGVGASLGIAVSSSVVTAATAGGPPTAGAFQAALWSSAVFVALALLTALLIRPATEN